MLRILFFLLILAGAALGIGYPWAASNVAGYEIGAWRVYDRDEGFSQLETNLAQADAPVSIAVEIRIEGTLAPSGEETWLTMKVTGDGEAVLTAGLDFADAKPRTINPQSGETAYREIVERLIVIDHDRYLFVFEAGEAGTDRLVSIDLILNAGAFDLDPRAIPVGFIMMAVGAVGFAGSFFFRRRENPNSKPPPPRWGRGK